jgi:tRNA(fMet)-specific endonuclease VapC
VKSAKDGRRASSTTSSGGGRARRCSARGRGGRRVASHSEPLAEYLFDTNTCIRILNGTSELVARRLAALDPSAVALCAVVKAELLYGARRSARAEANLRLLGRFFEPFVSLPFDDGCADECGRLRLEMERAGALIGANDLLIAATARAHGLVLVSHDRRAFGSVPGLKVEDWEVG